MSIQTLNTTIYSKSAIQVEAKKELESLIPGTYLDTLINVKAQQEYLSIIESGVRDDAQKEAEFQGLSESFQTLGIKAILKSTPAVYDYAEDAEYEYLANELKLAKEKLDSRKKILDLAIASPSKAAIDENGAIVKAPTELKPSGRTVAITLPK